MAKMEIFLFFAVLLVGGAQMKSVLPRSKRSTACFDKLGCFSNEGAFNTLARALSFVPSSPDHIRTRFYFYSREAPSPTHYLDARYVDTLIDKKWSYFKARPTKIIVHGFLDNPDVATWMKEMKDELLIYGDYNVIIVDWSDGNLPPYTQATANTRVVGAQIALLVKELVSRKGMDVGDFHIIGHSLGAHVAGYAGERLPGLTRITGLDPAGPYFENTNAVVRLDPTDAQFVDVIHSDAENLLHLGFGIKQQSGHADFYPNSGHDQPGCTRDPITQISANGLVTGTSEVVACNHLRAIKYYIESINTHCPFLGYPCASEDDFESNKCNNCTSDGCSIMGLRADQYKPPNGQLAKYFLTTSKQMPFCEYHLTVTVKFSSTSQAVEEKGYLNIQVIGDHGTSAEITLNESPVDFMPGHSYRFLVGIPSEFGKIQGIKLSWQHVSVLTDPLKWNVFGLRHPKIYIDEVDVHRQEADDEVHLCARPQGLETGHHLTIAIRC